MFKSHSDKKYFSKLLLLWLLMFLLHRLVFVLRYREYLHDVSFKEVAGAFYHGIWIDISAIGYLIAVPLILYTLTSFLGKRTLLHTMRGTNFLLVLLWALICAGELGTYGEWEGKLSAKVLVHLANPSEAFKTASFWDSVFFFITVIAYIGGFMFCYRKYVENEIANRDYSVYRPIRFLYFLPLYAGAVFLMIRGGLQPIPIQLSSAYYSSNQFLNDVSVNSFWSFGNSLSARKMDMANVYMVYEENEAKTAISMLLEQEDGGYNKILKITRPNIVFVILESWSADVIESLGGYSEITPHFDKLVTKGVLFDNFYAAGWTSDQAMSAMYSGAVVYPGFSVINEPESFKKLPAITQNLHELGYNSSYFFGGDLDYGNIKAYLVNKGFQKVRDEDYYDNKLPRGELGVQDGDMFNQYLMEIDQLAPPFFTNLFTLSTHSPYDFPGDRPIKWGKKHNNYLNSIWYADSCLGDFMEKAKLKPWYDNTLFVVLADHSHVSPKQWRACDKQKAKVPMLLLGNVIKDEFKGVRQSKIGNHLDIPGTLLPQLGLSAFEYKYSKNLLDTLNPGYATFTYHSGYGWITEEMYFGYSTSLNKMLCNDKGIEKPIADSIVKQGRSFFQVSFQDYYQ